VAGGLEIYNAATGQQNTFGSVVKGAYDGAQWMSAKDQYIKSKLGNSAGRGSNSSMTTAAYQEQAAKLGADFDSNVEIQKQFFSPQQQQELGIGVSRLMLTTSTTR